MKIGIDIRVIGKNRTGDEAYFFNLVKNLARLDRENEYFLFTDRDPEKDTALKKEISKLEIGNNFKILFINSPNRFWWNFRALPNNLGQNPIDIFHTQYIAPFWLPRKTRLILTIHDISFNFFPQFIKKNDLFFLKTLLPRSIRRAEKIITVSESERQKIVDFYKLSPEKVEFAYNGVDFEKLSQKASEGKKSAVRKKYSLPEKFILYLGTFQPRKNIPVLIEAFDFLRKKFEKQDIKLVLAGNRQAHNFDQRIDELIEKYNFQNEVIFPGWVDDVDKPILYQMADCFVFPSLYEGFGLPVLEAMAAGVPIACSDIAPLREIGDGSALFTDPQKPEEFAENIHKILTDHGLREKLIESGAVTAQKFSWQKTTGKTLEIYKSVLG